MTIIEDQFTVETAAEKLLRLGKTQVISGASVQGANPVLAVNYGASTYKSQERYTITQELPVDSGQGYQFNNTSFTEV